jgi:hypothetical protein
MSMAAAVARRGGMPSAAFCALRVNQASCGASMTPAYSSCYHRRQELGSFLSVHCLVRFRGRRCLEQSSQKPPRVMWHGRDALLLRD